MVNSSKVHDFVDAIDSKIDNKITEAELNVSEITVDDELDEDSTNPVQNKVINTALNGKADSFDFIELLDITIQNMIGME